MTTRSTVLPNGLRVLTEEMPSVRSAAVGVWVGVGSRDESIRLHGCSHFLEHLLFKGTPTRTAMDISVALDEVGGEFNAYTAKEFTVFHARVLDADLPLATDILGDMICHSMITPEDVEAERDVILDEIAMHDDDPDDVAHNLFAAVAFGDQSPLGRDIAGTHESISALTRDEIAQFYRAHYVSSNIVVAAAGNLDHDAFVAQVAEAFAALEPGACEGPARRAAEQVQVHSGSRHIDKGFEQVNLVLGTEGLRRTDDRRFALGVVNTILGGGTSSRLFQEVREHRGLAYSIYSFTAGFADTGLFGVAVGCLPTKRDEVLRVVRDELARLAADGITEEELARGKGQMRGGLVLGLEDSASRMSRLGKAELVHDDLLSIDEVIGRIDAVTLQDANEVAAEILRRPEILAEVGPA